MKNTVLDQLARTGLLPESASTAILAGDTPPMEEIVLALVIGSWDAEAMTANNPASTWNERRLARQSLIIAFLAALAVGQ